MTYKDYLKAKKEYEEAIKFFNDKHRDLKQFKKEVLLPAGRKLAKLEKEVFKSNQC